MDMRAGTSNTTKHTHVNDNIRITNKTTRTVSTRVPIDINNTNTKDVVNNIISIATSNTSYLNY